MGFNARDLQKVQKLKHEEAYERIRNYYTRWGGQFKRYFHPKYKRWILQVQN